MTDKINGFTVTLDKDIRDDDFEAIEKAIYMIKHVAHVEPHISTYDDHFAKQQLNDELRGKFLKFVKENLY